MASYPHGNGAGRPSPNPNRVNWTGVAVEFGSLVLTAGIVILGTNFMMDRMDPTKKQRKAAEADKKRLVRKLIANGRQPFSMNEYEAVISSDMVYPEDLDVGFDMIGGLEYAKKEIFDMVALPLHRPDLFAQSSSLVSSPKGILLYGPPGTGKTMMAKAIAKESGAAFINLKMSTTMNKWFGESQKLVRAAFSLAQKLSPCIIFIDEIDSFLRERTSEDHAALGNMKAEFMALWDGLVSPGSGSNRAYGVIVIGATNRPWDVDPAILRRMPRAFELGLPTARERAAILSAVLKGERVEKGFSLTKLAEVLEGYSGSDLKELCRAAAMIPFREYCDAVREQLWKEQKEAKLTKGKDDGANSGEEETVKTPKECNIQARPLAHEDFIKATKTVRPTGASAYEYQQQTIAEKASKGRLNPGGATPVVPKPQANGTHSDFAQSSLSKMLTENGISNSQDSIKAYMLGAQQTALLLQQMQMGNATQSQPNHTESVD